MSQNMRKKLFFHAKSELIENALLTLHFSRDKINFSAVLSNLVHEATLSSRFLKETYLDFLCV